MSGPRSPTTDESVRERHVSASIAPMRQCAYAPDPSLFSFFLRERCDLTTDQDRPPLGDAHPAQPQHDRTGGGLPPSKSAWPPKARRFGSARTHVATRTHAAEHESKRSVQAHTHAARSRCTPYIRPISLRPQADPTCAAPCEATLSSPAHHAASEVEAPPSPITPFVSSCRYFPRSAHSVSLRMTYTAPCT